MEIHGHITLPDGKIILTDPIEIGDNDYFRLDIDWEGGNAVGGILVKVPRPEDG